MQADVEKRVAEFVESCRRRGVKATHQRMEILRELAGSDAHPDAETVYAKVRRRIPAISLDTVYRTLRMFEEQGIITRVGSVTDRTRFDANTDRHLHFVCSTCGRIGDVWSEIPDLRGALPGVQEWGTVDSVYVELRGRCRKCCGKHSAQ